MRRIPFHVRRCNMALLAAAANSACEGPQSTLAPAGETAARVAGLFWWMAAGAVVVWVAVMALAIWSVRVSPSPDERRRRSVLVIGGGALVPTLVLTVLLVSGLRMLPDAIARAPDGSLEVHVIGEQFWWRVRYLAGGGVVADGANEIRLPVGEPVQFRLESHNVIHSFWIPALAGKMDMIPGRTTYLTVRATRTGVFRGTCAEYCGASHAHMSFGVEVLARPQFDAWLARQAAPRAAPASAQTARGEHLFFATGCHACHTIRGTAARGVVGPDLTHVGGRMTLAAGLLANDRQAYRTWITSTARIKPGVHMPAFGMLPDEDIEALAVFLDAVP